MQHSRLGWSSSVQRPHSHPVGAQALYIAESASANIISVSVRAQAGQLQSQVAVVLGSQWGDEGKGKLVDILAQQYDLVARAQVRGPTY